MHHHRNDTTGMQKYPTIITDLYCWAAGLYFCAVCWLRRPPWRRPLTGSGRTGSGGFALDFTTVRRDDTQGFTAASQSARPPLPPLPPLPQKPRKSRLRAQTLRKKPPSLRRLASNPAGGSCGGRHSGRRAGRFFCRYPADHALHHPEGSWQVVPNLNFPSVSGGRVVCTAT